MRAIEERVGVGTALGTSTGSDCTVSAEDVFSPIYVNAPIQRKLDTDGNGTLDQTVYFTSDANFDVTSVISGGSVEQRQVYDAYGNVTFKNASFVASSDGYGLTFLYQGMRFDNATGWDYSGESNMARWYSPTLQIWGRPDDIGYSDGTDRMEFAGDNPINTVDPSGLEGEDSETVKVLHEQALLQTFRTMESATNKTSSQIGAAGTTAVEGIKHVGDAFEMLGAMRALEKAITAANANDQLDDLNKATSYVGREEVKALMQRAAEGAGETLEIGEGAGDLLAATLIDAWRTGDEIGQAAANNLDDAFVQNVYEAAKNNGNLTNGSLMYQPGACGGVLHT